MKSGRGCGTNFTWRRKRPGRLGLGSLGANEEGTGSMALWLGLREEGSLAGVRGSMSSAVSGCNGRWQQATRRRGDRAMLSSRAGNEGGGDGSVATRRFPSIQAEQTNGAGSHEVRRSSARLGSPRRRR